MGIILDTVKMLARLPADKIAHLQGIFENFQNRLSSTLKELQSLTGKLNLSCKVIPPGRPFLQRMIALTRNMKQQHHFINKEWSEFFLVIVMPPELCVYGTKWFQEHWQPHQLLGVPNISIAWQELFAIVVVCHIWGALLQKQLIEFNYDNEVVVNMINS